MNAMIRMYCRHHHRSDGLCPECQTLVEYALILVLIAIVVIVVLTLTGQKVCNAFSNIANKLG